MKKLILSAVSLGLLMASGAVAQEVKRTGAAESPISTVVTVPPGYTTYYVSGLVPPVVDKTAPAGSPAVFGGSTEVQTEGVILRIKEALAAEGLGLGDVVMMRVYLVGDPALGGKLDFGGMMKSYKKYFGTAEQPNKPSRVTTQVAALAGEGMLVEIEVQAVKKTAPPPMPKKAKK
jgi:enamine deaminase RidA (YjgF/YER057c/UK114 family)